MKKLIAWLKSLLKRKPKSTRVIVVNGRSVYIKNDDSFTIENGVVRHKDPNVVIRPTIVYSSVQPHTLGSSSTRHRCDDQADVAMVASTTAFAGTFAASLSNECSRYNDSSSSSDNGSSCYRSDSGGGGSDD